MAKEKVQPVLTKGSEGLSPPQRQALAEIWRILPEARLVGGVVRDLMVGRTVADVDLATPEPPEQVQEKLEAAGIKVVPTGLSHGTVTAVIGAAPYEITTLRRDTETDGRHAIVCWTQDWREDALRRDFTINAMSRDKEGQLHDYFGGQADLLAGHVRFVGQAGLRIEEDALRILRFFRFQARYGQGQPDPDAVKAIAGRVGLLARLSVERIWSELQRLLSGPAPAGQLALMAELGVLGALFPQGVTLERFSALMDLMPPADAVLRLAALVQEDVTTLARGLKFSRADEFSLKALTEQPVPAPDMDDAALRCLLSDTPAAILIGRTWLAQADLNRDKPQSDAEKAQFERVRHRLATMDAPVFPLAGRDLLAAGLPPGPEVGRILAHIRQWWQQGGCVASRQACLAYAGLVS